MSEILSPERINVRPCQGAVFRPAEDYHLSTCGTCTKHYSHGGKCGGWGGKFHADAAGVELREGR